MTIEDREALESPRGIPWVCSWAPSGGNRENAVDSISIVHLGTTATESSAKDPSCETDFAKEFRC